MDDRRSMMRLLPLLREYGVLERKRVHEGVTPAEYQRWRDLEQRLSTQIFKEAGPRALERRRHVRVPTRMLIEYRSRDQLRQDIISNVSKGGLFISTRCPAEIGAHFVLVLCMGNDAGESVEVPCEVVSNNVSATLPIHRVGMGVKFIGLGAEQRRAVDRLFAEALGHESLEALWGGEEPGDATPRGD